MAIYKCKMCGGELNASEGARVAECDYCGVKQTVPSCNDEGVQRLFNRANTLRLKSEFDKAASLYEKILQLDDTQAEAYWGALLCRYGIEYVEDTKTMERKPTCHRASFDSIVADEDYKQALAYADDVQKEIYISEAAEIDRIQKEILALAQNEDAYDVFICYKEIDESGQRTEDSVIANDIYYELQKAGLKAFYAAITLENKLGTAYEPAIFAALNSARVMLCIGTRPEYFNAAWVRNEWSRFLKIMGSGGNKALIPCYKDMDAYELPEEFAHLQAQDMSKIGFVNDIIRGVQKLMKGNKPEQMQPSVVVQNVQSSNVEAMLKRGNMALEDKAYGKAHEFFEEVLNQDPECAEAYFGKVLADERCGSIQEFEPYILDYDADYKKYEALLPSYVNYKRTLQYANAELKEQLENLRAAAMQKKERNIKKLAPIRKKYAQLQNIISVGGDAKVGVNVDGTVSGCAGKLKSWTDIVAVSSGYDFVVGLKADGTVISTEFGWEKGCLKDWRDIVAISTGVLGPTVGLKSDGTVVKASKNGTVELNWTDIVAINVRKDGIVGLKVDGTVVATGKAQKSVENWREVVAISSTTDYTVGLRADGTVVGRGTCRDWTDIVAISTGGYGDFGTIIVGLKADGTVVVTGEYQKSVEGVLEIAENWRDIVAVNVYNDKVIGLKSDGTVEGLEGVKLFNDINNLEEERAVGRRRVAEERRIAEEERLAEERRIEEQKEKYRKRGRCQYCGGRFDLSLIARQCKKCGRMKDY